MLTALEWLWGELSFPLRHGAAESVDGFGREFWFHDPEARTTETLWSRNPGSYSYTLNRLEGLNPAFSAALQCAWGLLRNVNVAGFSDEWRYLYHPPVYLGMQADCRVRKASTREWGRWARYGGGSYPDWISQAGR